MVDFEKFEKFVLQCSIPYKKKVSMKNLTSFKIGGICEFIVTPKDCDSLRKLLDFCCSENISYFFLGNGSNILASDDGYYGVIISSKNLNKIRNLSNNRIYCESGVNLFKLCMIALNSSLSGLEELYGIPGSLGGAIYMNAGAFGKEIKDLVEMVKFLDYDGNLYEFKKDELKFSYRYSVFKEKKGFILGATLKLKPDENEKIKLKMDEFLKIRKEKQPINFPNAGSIFKRPKNGFAAKLIEESGLKGEEIGGAKISEKHCGFIVNFNNASFCDVRKLIEKIEKTVKIKKGVELEREVIFLE